MDVASFIVVLIVETADLSDPSTAVMTRTVQETLEGRAVVVVRDAEREGLADPNAAALGSRLRADAVAVVTWSHPERGRAFVHLYRARDASWVERDMSFRPEDPPAERGRMLGFEVASMVPPSAEPARPAPPPDRAPAPAVEPLRRPIVSIDAVAAAATGIGGPAGGFGGGGSVRVWLTDAIALRAEGGLRAGQIPSARATATIARLGAGVATRLFETRGAQPFTLGARLELLAIHHAVTSSDNGSSGARWVPGAGAAGELAWLATPILGVVGALGVEVAGGTTRVFLGDQAVDSVPPFRALGELGLRLSF